MQASVPSRHSQCVGLYTQKSDCRKDNRFLCHSVTDYRTIVENFYKVAEFVEWLKENHPDKASYHTSKM